MNKDVSELDFATSLFANMKINNIHEFSINKLNEFIIEMFKKDEIRENFPLIDSNMVISTGLSYFQIIGGIHNNLSHFNPRARITFSKDTSQELLQACDYNTNFFSYNFLVEYAKENKIMSRSLAKL